MKVINVIFVRVIKLSTMMEKTVYFLGSGFSKEAGGLVQNEIIKTILDEDFTWGNERLIKAKNNFIGFLKEEMHIYEDH